MYARYVNTVANATGDAVGVHGADNREVDGDAAGKRGGKNDCGPRRLSRYRHLPSVRSFGARTEKTRSDASPNAFSASAKTPFPRTSHGANSLIPKCRPGCAARQKKKKAQVIFEGRKRTSAALTTTKIRSMIAALK